MSESRIEVRAFVVRLMCDKCGEGEMKKAWATFCRIRRSTSIGATSAVTRQRFAERSTRA